MSEEELLAQKLGFRIDVRPDGNAGAVVWTDSNIGAGVRPATGVELRLWGALLALLGAVDPEHIPGDVLDGERS